MPGDLATFVRHLFPKASPPLLALFDGAIENAALLHTDFLSIHDLLDLSSYHDHENLHVLLLLMFLALSEGSLCLEVSNAGLCRRMAELVSDAQAQTWAEQILGDLGERRFPRLIGSSIQDSKPIILHDSADRQHLYFHKYLHSELILRDELRKRVTSDEWRAEPRKGPDAACHPAPHGARLAATRLDRDQLLALGLALTRNFVVISGGPGTGKTSLVLALLRCLLREGISPDRIALAAPTGRAAQRLTDSLREPWTVGQNATTDGTDKTDNTESALSVPSVLSVVELRSPHASPDLFLQQLQAATLHHLLEYSPTRGIFRRHAENPLAADVVIVDEVSMVGVVLMAQLLQAVPPKCKLILLGDKDQLPSVEAGAVLAGLVPSGPANRFRAAMWETFHALFPEASLEDSPGDDWPDHVAVLQVNHRSQAGIRNAALAINGQDEEFAKRLPALELPDKDQALVWWKKIEGQGGCWLVEPSVKKDEGGRRKDESRQGSDSSFILHPSSLDLRRVLQRWARHHFLDGYARLVHECELEPGAEDDQAKQAQLRQLFALLDGSRILTLVREGPWGCVGINQYLDQYLRPGLDRGARGSLFAGAPVLITANDHVRQLYNGDVGLALKSQGGLRVVFPRRGGFLSFSVESLPSHELGLALTVHKSQGSEYDSVLLVLPPTGGRRLLTKEIVYTGITRARNLALIHGSRETLRLAIRRKILRESGLLASRAP